MTDIIWYLLIVIIESIHNILIIEKYNAKHEHKVEFGKADTWFYFLQWNDTSNFSNYQVLLLRSTSWLY